MVYIEISLPIAFPDHRTTRQFLHIYEFSEQIFVNFRILALSVHICLSKTHTIIYCPQNVLKQKLSEDFLWDLKIHQITL